MGAGLEGMAMETSKIPDGVTERWPTLFAETQESKVCSAASFKIYLYCFFLTIEPMCLNRGCLRVSVVPKEVGSVQSYRLL